MVHAVKVVAEVTGSVVVAYFAIRVIATLVDIGRRAWRRLRGDTDAWKTAQELEQEGK